MRELHGAVVGGESSGGGGRCTVQLCRGVIVGSLEFSRSTSDMSVHHFSSSTNRNHAEVHYPHVHRTENPPNFSAPSTYLPISARSLSSSFRPPRLHPTPSTSIFNPADLPLCRAPARSPLAHSPDYPPPALKPPRTAFPPSFCVTEAFCAAA